MKKIDFRKITIKDVEGNDIPADISKQLGNQMYMQGQNIEECELGRDIYHNGEVELDEQQAKTVERFVGSYSYIMRTPILEMLGVTPKNVNNL